MLNLSLLPRINLRLFDGEGAGAAPADAGATGDTNGSPAAAGQGKSGDLSKVVYGRSPDAPAAGGKANDGAAAAEGTLEARQQEFDELVNGKYKDIYTQRTQEMIDRRFAKAKTAEAQNEKLRALADTLSQAYGITDDDGDYSKLTEAINNDDNIWSIAADEAGMSTAQYREFMRYKMEAQRAQESQQELVRQQQSREKAEAWFQEAQSLRAKFPGFDLRAELADPNFVAAISAPGMTLEMAYKAKHFDELMNGTIQAASAATEKRVTQNIRAKGARPAENGTSQRAAATIKSDPSKLTLEDFEEISRRLARGEKIAF